jgi:ATP-binding cassette subfamily F protein uup
MQDPSFYRNAAADIVAANNEVAARQSELEAAYARWMELENR